MNKFFVWLGGILLFLLLAVLVGVVVYNNVPAVKGWADGLFTSQEEQSPEEQTQAQITFENEFAKVIIG